MKSLHSANREKLKQLIKHTIKRSRRSTIAEDIKDEVKHDTGELKEALDGLNEKMDELITIRTAHDRRVLELEQKIKEKVSDNYIEILHLEQHLISLEEHFKNVRKKGYDPTIIQEIKDKIDMLRGKVKERKTRMAMTQITTKPRQKIIMPPPKQLRPMIRHEMHFKQRHNPQIPSAPPAPPMPPITPPFIKREPRHRNKFWDVIERLYGG